MIAWHASLRVVTWMPARSSRTKQSSSGVDLLKIYPWREMPKQNGAEPTQETPAGEEIPIPTREEVFRDLGKAAKNAKPLPEREGRTEEE